MKAAPLLLAAVLLAGCGQPAQAETAVRAPGAARTANEPGGLKTAIFAGGCFWGIEGVFSHVNGVTSAVSGYHGGSAATAKYGRVTDGDTGHAEAVRVTYNPAIVRYDQLLQVLYSVGADPTALNYQGPDRGTQYRTAVIPLSDEQRDVARAYLAQLGASRKWKRPIAAKIESYKAFYPAESYHQDFMAKNPGHAYIEAWDRPKMIALKSLYPALYRAKFTRN